MTEGERIIKNLNAYINDEKVLHLPTGALRVDTQGSGSILEEQKTGRFGKDDFGLLQDPKEEEKDQSLV